MIEDHILNEFGKRAWKHKSNKNLFLEHPYKSVDKLFLIDESSGRQVIDSFDVSSFNFNAWTPITKEEHRKVEKTYSQIYSKYIQQRLTGSDEEAEKEAIYVWEKDEIGYTFNQSTAIIYKIKFTGERWLVGLRFGRSKIYQYEYLNSSNRYEDVKLLGLERNGISHDSELNFYQTKEEAVRKLIRMVEQERDWALKIAFEKLKHVEFYRDSAETT